ncbi:uncharacterized protein LOC126657167 [Mercurialis annua]|uniref:uncharacterized protein LOC126657167 n=1 Tax=Mercurialis annua TaxID=3986 RepID=UPI002160951F|nr:uncharacterized protein LOC126657167 [Mercurialis annua]
MAPEGGDKKANKKRTPFPVCEKGHRSQVERKRERKEEGPRRPRPEPAGVVNIDGHGLSLPHEDALVVKGRLNNFEVSRMLVDTGSSVNMIIMEVFNSVGLKKENLTRVSTPLEGLGCKSRVEGSLEIDVQLGDGDVYKEAKRKSEDAKNQLEKHTHSSQKSSYNTTGVDSGTSGEDRKGRTLWAYLEDRVVSRKRNSGGRRARDRNQTISDKKSQNPQRFICLDYRRTGKSKSRSHMPSIKFATDSKPVVQKKRRHSPEKQLAVAEDITKLKKANVIKDAYYPRWVANVVMVKKSNGTYRMCVDFTDLNRCQVSIN